MPLLTLPFPNLDPVAIAIGPVAIKWYGLAYACGLLLGWLYIKRMLAEPRLWPAGKAPFDVDRTDDLLLYMTLGVVLGGRLGYVLFYKPADYIAHPAEIFAVWKGGMSFHGGFIGSVLAILYFTHKHVAPLTPRVPVKSLGALVFTLFGNLLGFFKSGGRNTAPFWSVFDVTAAATPIGLFFGRLANFINAELWGRPSNVPWAMVFPDRDAGPLPRHPSQLYEASLEGLALFILCWWLIHKRDAFKSPGLVAGVFTAGYGAARAFCEIFREPDPAHWATSTFMTAGILYSLPMIAIGLWIVHRARRAPQQSIA